MKSVGEVVGIGKAQTKSNLGNGTGGFGKSGLGKLHFGLQNMLF